MTLGRPVQFTAPPTLPGIDHPRADHAAPLPAAVTPTGDGRDLVKMTPIRRARRLIGPYYRAARARLNILRTSAWRIYYALAPEHRTDRKKRSVGFVAHVHRQHDAAANCGVKVIAFYLPQFHPIPENDQWWGTGFTEWANVVDAVPQFIGHYQPRLPSALGFYDLRVIDVQRQQAQLAKHYGVYGFMYYYYWFRGHRLLERPLQQMLATPDIDLPFCICWANENWTRRWDGREDEVLVAQEYSAQDDVKFIDALLPVFRDPRYIRIDGRPLLVVYRADVMPDPMATVARWTERCIGHGEKPPYVLRTNAFCRDIEAVDPTSGGFSGVMEFPPHGVSREEILITPKMRIVNPRYEGHVYDYSTAVQRELRKKVPNGCDYYRCVFPSWDNEARRKGRGETFAHSSPALYGQWLKHACEHAAKELPADRRFVFVNAWNEWAEGAYLEPDRRYGYAYLQATADVLRAFTHSEEPSDVQSAAATPTKACAVILHLSDPNRWEEAWAALRNISLPFDLYVSVPCRAYADARRRINGDFQGALLLPVDGPSGDMLSFLRLYLHAYRYRYKYICRVCMGSGHQSDERDLRHARSFKLLLGSSDRIARILETLDKRLNVGIVAADGLVLTVNGGKTQRADKRLPWVDAMVGLLADMGIDYRGEPFCFVPGGMFWFRPEALAGILRRTWREEEFSLDSAATGEAMLHALERAFGVVTGWSGFHIVTISDTSC